MTTRSATYEVVPTHLAVQAMRDNGYKNAAYAIAELIDNSIQAGATSVELLCIESEEQLSQRRRRRISQVAVLDNGSGMDANTLRMALQFGNGRYLNDRSGIGRFGMGLPNSSISQCRHVDVWSWQTGPDNALHTYLDLSEIGSGSQTEVPDPVSQSVPDSWRSLSKGIGGSGTLVVWSQLDRCMWKTAQAIIDNSEFIIGRMYRRFIYEGRAIIRLATFLSGNFVPDIDKLAKANDPLYLMSPTSTNPPYDNEPMFEPYGVEGWEVKPKIQYNGAEHEVIVRFTVAKLEARSTTRTGQPAGSQPHGLHARRNVGISIMRAGRELELDQSWVNTYDPRERWWGVEVEFPPSLDEIFGVTNNKQFARHFSETPDIAALIESGKTVVQLKEEMREDEDPRGPLIDIADLIKRNLGSLRRQIEDQARHTDRSARRRYGPDSPEVLGTRVVRERQAEGYQGVSDQDEGLPDAERQQSIQTELEERGVPEEQARELAARTVSTGMKYLFTQSDIETSAFFSVRPRGGAIMITLNTAHPAYGHLIEALDEQEGIELTDAELRSKLANASRGLRLLLEAWARYEDEQPDGQLRARVQDARNDWGRVARQFLGES